ncbi:MAG TPA: cytochrome d ubiquinol oxidase subunit II [Acidimicrobiales bacterium]|nr:cytochrome d ubiquinol oxidase subunit II [Acidimicrobiales bacterium]
MDESVAADLVAAILFLGVVAYAVFAGADFGSGVWDLTAGDAEAGAPLRTLVDRAIGPVWEANHVWLIFVLVYLWTGFPGPFASIMETLFVPFGLAAVGIVLRGAAFAFRKTAPDLAQARLYGACFAASSVVTPFFFGTIAGAVAAGRVPAEGAGDRWTSWTGPTSLVGGGLAVLTCAFLAAVFLTAEADRSDDDGLVRYCRQRALGTGILTGGVALVGVLPLRADAPTLFDGLTGRALPLIVISAAAGSATLWALWRERFEVARVTAAGAVAAVVVGWGVGQWPWLLVDQVKVEDAAGASATMWALVVVFGLAAVTVLPSLAYLFWITQRAEH